MKAKEFRENQGVSIPEWNDIIDKMLEAYNKSKVEAISDEMNLSAENVEKDPIESLVSEVSKQILENFNSEQQRQFIDSLDSRIRANYNSRIEEQMMKLQDLQKSFEIYNNTPRTPHKTSY